MLYFMFRELFLPVLIKDHGNLEYVYTQNFDDLP